MSFESYIHYYVTYPFYKCGLYKPQLNGSLFQNINGHNEIIEDQFNCLNKENIDNETIHYNCKPLKTYFYKTFGEKIYYPKNTSFNKISVNNKTHNYIIDVDPWFYSIYLYPD